MNYQSVADTAKSWNVSERTVRNYCATGKIPGAVLIGKTWNVPQDAERPERINKKQQAPRTLLTILQDEMTGHVKGGIYHKIQIDLTYNSNHIEGSRLSHDQTRYIYETNTIGMENGVVNVDDVVETANHFKCIDMVIRDAKKPINEALIKKLGLSNDEANLFKAKASADRGRLPNAQMEYLMKHRKLLELINYGLENNINDRRWAELLSAVSGGKPNDLA